MRNAGYFRTPTVYGEQIVFVSEDDLWTVPLAGGIARRLTAGLGASSRPVLSPEGTLVAFTSQDEAHPEVYVMPATGGQPRRVTYLGATTAAVAWTPDGLIVFRSDAGQPFQARRPELFTVDPAGGEPSRLNLGWAHDIAYGPNGAAVLGRNTIDPATWKRYRGGRVGRLWVDARGSGTFKPLVHELGGNVATPMWVGKRIYFLSDHEGVGNVYSCRPDGKDVRRHTDHDEYYARFASTDGMTIVYHHGAEIWALDVASDTTRRVEIDFPSPRAQRNRKFPDAAEFLHEYRLHPEGHSIAIETRGRPFTMPLWDGGVREYGAPAGVRYRSPQWLPDGERIVVVSDEGGEEALEIYGRDGARIRRFDGLDLGRMTALAANPKQDVVAWANHRLELFVVDLGTGRSKRIDVSEHGNFHGLTWSHDGAWLAYSSQENARTRAIKIAELATGRTRLVTRPDFVDVQPAWDPDGRYLYFLSFRIYDPVYDAHFFDLGFPKGMRPYLIALAADARAPFVPEPKGFGNANKKDDAAGGDAKKKKDKADAEPKPIRIDFDGIEDRLVAFPVPEKRYGQIAGIKNKVLFTSYAVEGSLGNQPGTPEDAGRGTLEVYDLEQMKHEVLVGGVTSFTVSRDGATLVYRAGRRLRAVKAGDRPDEKFEKDPPNRRSGWIDLGRVRVSVDPGAEWRQMYEEAWRLQRDNFWTADMSGVDWNRVLERYRPLVEKVATRIEFSDLMWEMQGELGTSHAYEMGGDHRRPPMYTIGHLAADFRWDPKARGYTIESIVRGDAWDETKNSPLASVGANVREGETLLAVNGRALDATTPPQALLVNQSGQYVELTVGDRRGRNARVVTVKTLAEEWSARYRAWVERNRAYVHERSNGRVGYVHVPNMGPLGYSEFHRYYNAELEHDALLVDVRFNGGGHVSQIILEKLARKRIGYDIKRWGQPDPYPSDSVIGPMVCVTNESAGSDGDIFTHCFKLMGLGPVVGKRTWGGVIGISPRHVLVDNGYTTQPEFSFWFVDVGWNVENYGTDPDYDVDIAPHDARDGRDPQLDKALDLLAAALKRNPPKVPSFEKRPKLPLPKLPKR